jgi:hypothetical protein
MCCRRSGHDHRPAMITKPYKPVILAHRLGTFLGIQGTPERAGFSPLGRPIRDHLQLITLPSSAHAAAPSYGAESMIEASVSANGRVAGRLPIRADPETIHRRVVQPVTQLVAIGCRSQDQQRQDRHVRPNSIEESLWPADPPRDSPSPASAETAATAPGAAARNHPPAIPLAARRYLGGPKLASAAFTVFGEHPTTRGCRRPG